MMLPGDCDKIEKSWTNKIRAISSICTLLWLYKISNILKVKFYTLNAISQESKSTIALPV